MNKPTICVKCEFHTTMKIKCRHVCIAQVTSAMNFVTGKKYLTGYEACKDANPYGKCVFYKEDKDEPNTR